MNIKETKYEDHFSAAEAAKHLNTSRTLINRMIDSERISVVVVGRAESCKVLIPPDQYQYLARYLGRSAKIPPATKK